MSNIVDPNNRPIETEDKAEAEAPATEEKKGSNGESNQGVADIRAIPIGTLIYNLGLAILDERATGMAVQQMNQMKQEQKLVVDPPPLMMAKAHLEESEKRRFAFANEINIRFRDSDKRRIDESDLEVVNKVLEKEEEEADASGD